MKKTILLIDGMTCSACSNGLEKYLNKQDGIEKADVNLIMNNASIIYDEKKVSTEDLDRFIKEAGFKSLGKYKLNFEEKQNKREFYKVIFLCILDIAILYISMAHMLNLPQIPFLDIDKYPLYYAISLLVFTSIAILFGFKTIKNGIKNLIHGTPNMDTLVTIGVLTSYIYSIYETYQIYIGNNAIEFAHKLYFETGAVVLFFVEVGKFIENRNKNKTKEALQKLVTITPKNAVIIKDGEEKDVTIDEIQKGDIVICRPGQKIAVDGEIVEGQTHIDESFVTGESTPAKKEIGMKVIAGSINFEGSIKYTAEKIGKESTISEIVKMVSEASTTKAPIGKLADKISGIFVPIVIAISIITLICWLIISKDTELAINMFVSCLVVACPCSLGLATPLAIVVATGKASQKGILVKSGESLENAHKIKNFFFDKTGTLTYGKLQVSRFVNYSHEKDEDVLKYIASVEKKSEHPIAKAVVSFAKDKKTLIVACSDFKAIPGQGVYAKIKDDEFYLGNRKIVNQFGLLDDDTDDKVLKTIKDEEELITAGNSILFAIKNNKIISLVGVKDIVRNDSKNVVEKLSDYEISVTMLSGDNEVTAKKIANEIGIESVISNCSPKEKSEKINDAKKSGITAMCGDGINDSVSLVNADIGIAISNGTDISINSADVVLMNDNLMKVIDLIDLSKNTVRIIKQNLFWAYIYNLCMIPVACGLFSSFGITINPMIGSFAMMISSLIVVFNSLRLKRM